jgi:SAM-dependent methyltransferase
MQLIPNIFKNRSLIQATFSNPRKKGAELPSKISIRPILAKGKRLYQISEQVQEKVYHRNVTGEECAALILEHYFGQFKQALLKTEEGDYQLLTNRKGETTLLTQPASKRVPELSHNRKKQYLLAEGTPIPFLIELGIMQPSGKVFPQKMDKFRQINRFLEMVADCLQDFKAGDKIHLVDFGCGKAYLTFALAYFLREVLGLDATLTGVDLKEDVIQFCKELAAKLGDAHLTFSLGNIASYAPDKKVDMVVALHACDTATDEALAKAVQWKAELILAAPCCQHELLSQIASKPLESLLQHGILKERFASLVTDAARAALLERAGYSTQLLEFIDSQHTPKNILIRAKRGNTEGQRKRAIQQYQELKKELSIRPTIEELLGT